MILSLFKNLCVAIVTVLAPIHAIMVVVFFLIMTDLIFGIWAAVKRGERITSSAMRRTISKILVYETVLIAAFVFEFFLLGGTLFVVKLTAAIIGAVEMKSLLESANDITGTNIFKEVIKKIGSDNDTEQK